MLNHKMTTYRHEVSCDFFKKYDMIPINNSDNNPISGGTMSIIKEDLNQNWFACTEAAEDVDLTGYAEDFRPEACISTTIPALLCNLFPTADTPLWLYRRFVTNLQKDDLHRIHLCFERVVCLCQVWINGKYIGKHTHSEEPFSMDITDAMLPGENLIACRVYGPLTDKVGPDGIAMDTVPNYAQVYSYYPVIPKTGIYGHVTLEKKPCVELTDRYIRPDAKTGSVHTVFTLQNLLKKEAEVSITASVMDRRGAICEKNILFTVPAESRKEVSTEITVNNFEYWSPDSPVLYTMNLRVSSICGTAQYSNRFGFRDFRVCDGYFHLNGKKIWLVGAHTSPSKEMIVHAKTMGFTVMRYLSEMPPEEILDFCDEIGMMVYEECAAAWGMSDYPDMEKHMAEYLNNMILRDRNHVSVAIWGIFNEQPGPNASCANPRIPNTAGVFEFAVNYLPQMRRLDPDRLILLSSGRWDAHANIGSYSNPGSDVWEYGWGAEAPEASLCAPGTGNNNLGPYITEVGDNHLYPTVPIQNDIRDFIRNIGKDTNPVFLSEYGVGYQFALYDQPKNTYFGTQIRRLEEWIEMYSLENIYPTPRDFLMASIEAGAAQRMESIDPIRANPKLCGYSLTSFTIGNEGVYYRPGSLIPGITDALRDSFAPLKWCFFTDSRQLYPHTPFTVEAVLANTGVLAAGEYKATVSVCSEHGVVWRENITFTYPEGNPFAASVMTLTLPGFDAGQYAFSVYVDDILQPTCAKMLFRVHDNTYIPAVQKIYPIGESEAAVRFLIATGAVMTDDVAEADIVLVGRLTEEEQAALSEMILQYAWEGKRVIILDYGFWSQANTSAQKFMEKVEFTKENGDHLASVFGYCFYYRNWLYHMDNYIADNTVFDGLAAPGLLDMDLFRRVYPDHYMIGTTRPAKTYCAAFGSGLFVQESCLGALTLGEFSFGKGSVVVNTFKLLDNIGKDPVADRILYNLLRTEQQRSE